MAVTFLSLAGVSMTGLSTAGVFLQKDLSISCFYHHFLSTACPYLDVSDRFRNMEWLNSSMLFNATKDVKQCWTLKVSLLFRSVGVQAIKRNKKKQAFIIVFNTHSQQLAWNRSKNMMQKMVIGVESVVPDWTQGTQGTQRAQGTQGRQGWQF